jgi:hypothetical protein
MPREEMHDQAVEWLAGAYGEAMVQSGDDTQVVKLLETHTGKDRKDVLGAVFEKYGAVGKFDEGLAFVDAHSSDPEARLDYIAEMVTWVPESKTMLAAMDWALSITPEAEAPEAARRLTATATVQRNAAEDAARKWLDAQPEGPVRDQGYAGIAEGGLKGFNYRKSLDAAAKIGDSSIRDATRQMIRKNWDGWVQKRGLERASENLSRDVVEQLQSL